MARGGKGRAGKSQVRQPPDGQVRRSQVVTTFGPGAVMDLVDQAVLVSGLDFWSYDQQRGIPVITEPRLLYTLAERFRQAGIQLSEDQAFREPPAGDDRDPNKSAGIQALEFPQWFVCQNPGCRALLRKDGLELGRGRYWHNCASTQKPSETTPVRFVAACPRGHVADYPWIAFTHLGTKRCSAPELELYEGASGDFSEIEVRCGCGERERLSAAFAKEFPLTCGGERPWLGAEATEECGVQIRLLVRSSAASGSTTERIFSFRSTPR